MELHQTAIYMVSGDYKKRFIAEYWQTKIRYEKLKTFLTRIEAAELMETEVPKHDCPYDLLRVQQSTMGEYLHILELRAQIENIDLNVFGGEQNNG